MWRRCSVRETTRRSSQAQSCFSKHHTVIALLQLHRPARRRSSMLTFRMRHSPPDPDTYCDQDYELFDDPPTVFPGGAEGHLAAAVSKLSRMAILVAGPKSWSKWWKSKPKHTLRKLVWIWIVYCLYQWIEEQKKEYDKLRQRTSLIWIGRKWLRCATVSISAQSGVKKLPGSLTLFISFIPWSHPEY